MESNMRLDFSAKGRIDADTGTYSPRMDRHFWRLVLRENAAMGLLSLGLPQSELHMWQRVIEPISTDEHAKTEKVPLINKLLRAPLSATPMT